MSHPVPHRSRLLASLAARLILGAVFSCSGFLKALDPAAFLLDVRGFHILPDPWAAWLAMCLPWLEILTGAALLSGLLPTGASWLAALMLTTFLAAIARSALIGLDIHCGCFGSSNAASSYPGLFLRNTTLLALAAFLIQYPCGKHTLIRKRAA
jgi:putative oxidoreductase